MERILRTVAVGFLLVIVRPAFGDIANQVHTPCTYHYSQETWQADKRQALVEIYRPVQAQVSPLVFVLHGSAGAFSVRPGEEPVLDNLGEKALARTCFTVVFPHYLEGIGRKSLTSRQEIAANFPQLLEVADSLLARAETLLSVQRQPVFLFGDSLGGYLSVALAFRRPEIAAISVISCGRPEGHLMESPRKLRVLISEGAHDTVVPPSEAEALDRYCRAHGLAIEIDMYAGENHYLSQGMKAEVLNKTVRLFKTGFLRQN